MGLELLWLCRTLSGSLGQVFSCLPPPPPRLPGGKEAAWLGAELAPFFPAAALVETGEDPGQTCVTRCSGQESLRSWSQTGRWHFVGAAPMGPPFPGAAWLPGRRRGASSPVRGAVGTRGSLWDLASQWLLARCAGPQLCSWAGKGRSSCTALPARTPQGQSCGSPPAEPPYCPPVLALRPPPQAGFGPTSCPKQAVLEAGGADAVLRLLCLSPPLPCSTQPLPLGSALPQASCPSHRS